VNAALWLSIGVLIGATIGALGMGVVAGGAMMRDEEEADEASRLER
jgi:hypothetical protein